MKASLLEHVKQGRLAGIVKTQKENLRLLVHQSYGNHRLEPPIAEAPQTKGLKDAIEPVEEEGHDER